MITSKFDISIRDNEGFVGRGGFEPPKVGLPDLQSGTFDHFATDPLIQGAKIIILFPIIKFKLLIAVNTLIFTETFYSSLANIYKICC